MISIDILQFIRDMVTVEVSITKRKRKTVRYEIIPYKLTDTRIEFLQSLLDNNPSIQLVEKQVNVLFALNIFNRWSQIELGTDNRVYCIDAFSYKRLIESNQNVFVEGYDYEWFKEPQLVTGRIALEQIDNGDVIYCNHFTERHFHLFDQLIERCKVKIISKAPKRNKEFDIETLQSIEYLNKKIQLLNNG